MLLYPDRATAIQPKASPQNEPGEIEWQMCCPEDTGYATWKEAPHNLGWGKFHEPMDPLAALVYDNLGNQRRITPAAKRQLKLLNKGK